MPLSEIALVLAAAAGGGSAWFAAEIPAKLLALAVALIALGLLLVA